MSDFTCGFLLLAKVEGVAVFPWYLSTPPAAANATIQYWKESGQWLPGVDETAPWPGSVVDVMWISCGGCPSHLRGCHGIAPVFVGEARLDIAAQEYV